MLNRLDLLAEYTISSYHINIDFQLKTHQNFKLNEKNVIQATINLLTATNLHCWNFSYLLSASTNGSKPWNSGGGLKTEWKCIEMSIILNQDGTERKQYLKSTFPLIIVNWSLCCGHQNLLSGHHYLHNGSKKLDLMRSIWMAPLITPPAGYSKTRQMSNFTWRLNPMR